MNDFDYRHGGPYDRGAADYWYQREYNPHYFKKDTYLSPRVEAHEMTAHELKAYAAGWKFAEKNGGQKDYG